MALETYRKKRRFDRTPEPAGDGEARSRARTRASPSSSRSTTPPGSTTTSAWSWTGCMKSWAVPKGPSLDPAVKRLAVHVEDHPIEYNTFEGVIPKGEYGGGPVLLWDRGRWIPEEDPARRLQEGQPQVPPGGGEAPRLLGAGAHECSRREGSSKESWLLIKHKDDGRGARGQGRRRGRAPRQRRLRAHDRGDRPSFHRRRRRPRRPGGEEGVPRGVGSSLPRRRRAPCPPRR